MRAAEGECGAVKLVEKRERERVISFHKRKCVSLRTYRDGDAVRVPYPHESAPRRGHGIIGLCSRGEQEPFFSYQVEHVPGYLGRGYLSEHMAYLFL